MHATKAVTIATCLFAILVICPDVVAQKSNEKGGGGKDGGTDGPSYAIVPLDDGGYILDGGRGEVGAFDISDVGRVVGAGYDPIVDRTAALFWYVDGTESLVIQLPDLESQDRFYAVGRSVNNLDQVVGYTTVLSTDGSPFIAALYWPSPLASPLVLPPLSEDGFAYAYDINDSGVICGLSRDPEFDADGVFVRSRTTPVVWSVTYPNGQPQVFGPVPLPAPEDGRANAVSSCDADGVARVAGGLTPANGVFSARANAAVTWRVVLGANGSLMADPQPLVLEAGEAEAFAINDTGAVAGQTLGKGRVWADGTGQTLADFPERKIRGVRYHALDIHAAYGINNSGLIVGNLDYASNPPEWEAALWLTPSSKPINLGLQFLSDPVSLAFSGLTEARAINASGAIVGKGKVNGNGFAFLAVPQ